jgi:hypothetical protein
MFLFDANPTNTGGNTESVLVRCGNAVSARCATPAKIVTGVEFGATAPKTTAEYWTTMPATVVPDIGACSRSDPAAPCLAANTAGCKATAMGFEDACVGLNAKAACEAVNSDSKTATQDCAFVPNAAAAGAAVDGLTTTAWNVPATATVRAAPRGPHRRKLYRVGPNCGPT